MITKHNAIISLFMENHSDNDGATGWSGKGDSNVLSNWKLNNNSEISFNEADVDARFAELQVEYDVQEYARNREVEYPSLKEQQDMQFHDAIDGTTTWQDAIQAVKNKYPKSE